MADIISMAQGVRDVWSAFWRARPLLTAVNLGVFEHTKQKKSAPEAARRMKTDPRATEILMDALAALGFLKKTGGLYKNSREADLFLVKSSPYYQGAIIKHADNLWQSWSQLDEIVRTGRPARAERDGFSLEAFILGMHNLAVLKTGAVLKAAGLKGVKNALDLGGGPGTYAMEMKRAGVPEVTLFDRPDVVKIAARHMKKLGVTDVKFLKGDFLRDDIGGGYDLVFMSNIHHSNSYDECVALMKKVKAALAPGGRGVINEFYLKANRAEPAGGALFSINMLVNTPAGRTYSEKELREFFRKAGFKNISQKVLGDGIVVQGRI